MEAIIIMLMLWIENHTTYETANIPAPNIVEMSAKALTKEAYSDSPDKIPENGVDERVYALYSYEDGPNGTIFIKHAQITEGAERYAKPADNPIFQERLLHELIHHIQRFSGIYDNIPCQQFSEKEAYLLGGEFLQQHKTKDPMPSRTFFAQIYSRC